ncbi:MAG TPA: hypothetical protein VGQ26_26860 [Streptosporangiaceae bacterium]|nr:hypothetical protein [Streptosporangiaceae bacterium]
MRLNAMASQAARAVLLRADMDALPGTAQSVLDFAAPCESRSDVAFSGGPADVGFTARDNLAAW